jgi:hypothetical protein
MVMTNDFASIEEWFIGHKKVSVTIIFLLIVFLTYWFFLHNAVMRYRITLHNVNELQMKLKIAKKIIVQREGLIKFQQIKIHKLEKDREFQGALQVPALWLSHHCSQCGIYRYLFTENNRFSEGGQKRPILHVTLQLNYAQALCILAQFSRYSTDLNLFAMTLNPADEHRALKLTLEVEHFIK